MPQASDQAGTKPAQDNSPVVLGKISGVFGVKGWVKVHSYTQPAKGILEYRHWLLSGNKCQHTVELEVGRKHGKGLAVKFTGFDDRDQAATLVNSEIVVANDALPDLPEGEYYWRDLIGLDVSTETGQTLGKVTGLMETGSNDVLVVRGDKERLIPYLPGQFVTDVDLETGLVTVSWDPEF